jgi:hypothetical protein
MSSRRDAKYQDAERSSRRLRRGDGFLMMVGMRLGRLVGVVLGVQIMRAGKMGMVSGGLVHAASGVFGGFAMMMRGVLVMLGRMPMMFGGALGVSHGRLLVSARVLRTSANNAIVRQASDGKASDVSFCFCEPCVTLR